MSKDLIQIRFLDGNEKKFSKGIRLHANAESISDTFKKSSIPIEIYEFAWENSVKFIVMNSAEL